MATAQGAEGDDNGMVGVMKEFQGLKAVLLFGGSSLAFCSRQESQCMTRHKVLATAIVVAGTAIYYLAPSTSPAELAASRDAAKGAELQRSWRPHPRAALV